MAKLILPKHTADLDYIMSAIKVYYDDDGWVSMSDYKDRLFFHLRTIDKEYQRNSDETHYTKCSEIPRYFGLLERFKIGNASSDVRITDLGREFYENMLDENYNKVHENIMKSLETVIFGRNNDGCGSDCDLEAPCIVIKSMLLLDGISNKEAAFILGQMVDNDSSFQESINKVKDLRREGNSTYRSSVTSDIKFIPFLKRIKFLDDGASRKTIVSRKVRLKYEQRLLNLSIKNESNY